MLDLDKFSNDTSSCKLQQGTSINITQPLAKGPTISISLLAYIPRLYILQYVTHEDAKRGMGTVCISLCFSMLLLFLGLNGTSLYEVNWNLRVNGHFW